MSKSAGASTLRIRITVDGFTAPIWRTLDVAADLSLEELHAVVRIAFGWRETHLHAFTDIDPRPQVRPLRAARVWGGIDLELPDAEPESEITIQEALPAAGSVLFEEYDFGDGWLHVIELLESRQTELGRRPAALVDGRRRGPLEDSGGPGGYESFCRAMADPTSAEHEAARDWFEAVFGYWEHFDPERFEPDAIDRELALHFSDDEDEQDDGPLSALVGRLSPPLQSELRAHLVRDHVLEESAISREAAEAMVRPYSWLIRRVGEGLQLTKAGWMPPAVVRQAMSELAWADAWGGSGNRENETAPVADLRATAQRLGLIRKVKGRLVTSTHGKRLVDDPVALWEFVARIILLRQRSAFAADALVLVAVEFAAESDRSMVDAIGSVAWGLDALGWVVGSGDFVTEFDVLEALDDALAVLASLDGFRQTLDGVPFVTDAGRAFARAILCGN